MTGVSGGAGETSAALCAACFELQRGKGARKFPRALWDYGNIYIEEVYIKNSIG